MALPGTSGTSSLPSSFSNASSAPSVDSFSLAREVPLHFAFSLLQWSVAARCSCCRSLWACGTADVMVMSIPNRPSSAWG
eukprot:7194736-Ditylum_brightwellii.AAC.1